MTLHDVRVSPLPRWLDWARLLGPADKPSQTEAPEGAGWHEEPGEDGPRVLRARLSTAAAADLAARLRGLGLDGVPVACEIDPPLPRAAVRRARTEDARRRRDTTPGFERRGARVDEEGRWSLTPERLALEIARWARGRPVVDAGCGVGGNAIAFARAGSPVIALERDRQRIELARHNARIYGVEDKIQFVLGDVLERGSALADPRAILFVDPPWGTGWDRRRTELGDLPLLEALVPLAGGYGALWAKVPPSFVVASVPRARARAMFGEATGDRRRIKFVILQR